MKKLAIIGGLSMMAMGGGYMIHHKQSITPKFEMNPKYISYSYWWVFCNIRLNI